jgi:hypothetical protein
MCGFFSSSLKRVRDNTYGAMPKSTVEWPRLDLIPTDNDDDTISAKVSVIVGKSDNSISSLLICICIY